MSSWLLVHPPLLGPAVLQPLAAELRRRGSAVAVPGLRAAVETAPGRPQRWVPAAAVAGPPEVVVGFSGAGIVLPAVAAAVGARRVVWPDAVLPTSTTSPSRSPRSGRTSTPATCTCRRPTTPRPLPRGPGAGRWVGDGTSAHLDVADAPRRIAHLLG